VCRKVKESYLNGMVLNKKARIQASIKGKYFEKKRMRRGLLIFANKSEAGGGKYYS